MTLKAEKENVPFLYIAYLIEKNKDTLTKLCIDLPIEEGSIKHFATLILNLTKLKHLHLTSNTLLDSKALPSLKHILTKDTLTSIIIDRLPVLEDFTLIGGFPTYL